MFPPPSSAEVEEYTETGVLASRFRASHSRQDCVGLSPTCCPVLPEYQASPGEHSTLHRIKEFTEKCKRWFMILALCSLLCQLLKRVALLFMLETSASDSGEGEVVHKEGEVFNNFLERSLLT
jgi:hypothetical protein